MHHKFLLEISVLRVRQIYSFSWKFHRVRLKIFCPCYCQVDVITFSKWTKLPDAAATSFFWVHLCECTISFCPFQWRHRVRCCNLCASRKFPLNFKNFIAFAFEFRVAFSNTHPDVMWFSKSQICGCEINCWFLLYFPTCLWCSMRPKYSRVHDILFLYKFSVFDANFLLSPNASAFLWHEISCLFICGRNE